MISHLRVSKMQDTVIQNKNARDAIRTHEPLQEWILSPSELAGLSYPRKYMYILTLRSDFAYRQQIAGHVILTL